MPGLQIRSSPPRTPPMGACAGVCPVDPWRQLRSRLLERAASSHAPQFPDEGANGAITRGLLQVGISLLLALAREVLYAPVRIHEPSTYQPKNRRSPGLTPACQQTACSPRRERRDPRRNSWIRRRARHCGNCRRPPAPMSRRRSADWRIRPTTDDRRRARRPDHLPLGCIITRSSAALTTQPSDSNAGWPRGQSLT
jgi:hypothetical protein